MLKLEKNQYESAEARYEALIAQSSALIEGEADLVANLSNLSALLSSMLEEINWVGFYLMKEGELVLGPFQGQVACVRIALGRGVCGTAAETGLTQRVPDVHDFPGHIACDGASRSELVIPLIMEERVMGVLDIDSPIVNRFSEEDAGWMEKWANRMSPLLYSSAH